MKKFLTVGFCSGLLLLSCTTLWASSTSQFTVAPVSDKALLGSQLLRLKVQDVQPKSGVCLYYVKQLNYLPALQILSVDLYQETCLNDGFGKSQGEIDWVVPAALLSTGTEIQLLVNQSKAGVLVYDETTQTFHVK